jgi:hypothetical protein
MKTRTGKTGPSHPGMTDKSTWRRSKTHKHTRWYGCVFCGLKFADPCAVYTHVDKRHRRGSLRRRQSLPSGGF